MNMGLARRIAVLAVAFCGISAGAGNADDWPAKMTIRGEERPVWPADDLRERGMDIADLDLKDNAARLYIEAINAYVELPADLEDAFRATLSDGLPRTTEGQRLVEWIGADGNRRAIELAVEASRMEQCQFPYFGEPSASLINVMLPSLSDIRHLTKLVVLDGRRLDAEGKPDAALRNYVAAFRMGHHVSRGGTLIESLVGIACAALSIDAISDQALADKIQPGQMESIAEQLQSLTEALPNTRRGMTAERNFGLSIVDTAMRDPLSMLSGMQDPSGMTMLGIEPDNRDTGWARLEDRVGRLALPDRTIKGHMAAFYDEISRRAQLPAFEANWNDGFEEQLLDKTVPQWNFVARIALPSLSRANVLSERLRAEFGLVRSATAIRLYAMRHDGVWPATLSDVESELDADAMIDPFSGMAFRYRRENGGWILYSLGEDLTDDGGKEEDNRNRPDMVVQFKQGNAEPTKDKD